jgi:hypothetical protein
MRSSNRLFLVLLLALSATPAYPADPADPAAVEFKFMEMRQRLRENPKSEEARVCLFALGEYYFMRHMPQAACAYFKDLKPRVPGTPSEFLTAVYLLRCAQLAQDTETAGLFEEQLKEALSSQQFFAVFRAARTHTWNSPLGNHYDFHEEVDRMEILLNGTLFYTIRLA